MPFILKHGKFELWVEGLNIHFKVLEMDESFRTKKNSDKFSEFEASNGIWICSDYSPKIYFDRVGNITICLWGIAKKNNYKETSIEISTKTEQDVVFIKIINALKEWDIWMDEQNPISDVQKQKNLEYHTRMVSIKGKEN